MTLILRYFASPNSVAFGARYAKVIEHTPTLSARQMQPKETSL